MLPREDVIKELAKVCQHGRDIINPYTGQHMYIPCGTCDTCLDQKKTSRSIKCEVQKSLSRYCYFVTLTYDQLCVPKCTISHVKDDLYCLEVRPRHPLYKTIKKGKRRYKRLVRGLSMTDSFKEYFKATPEYIREYKSQASLSMDGKYPRLNGRYGYLSRKDFQLFAKRLRFRCSLITGKYETLHMYYVGEYTPKHFRPHFHFLLFFESEELASCIGRVINSCWPFGLTDFSAARKDAASYVAAYVNSSVRLPYHLRQSKSCRPFSRFSNRFGESLFDAAKYRALQGRFSLFLDGVPCNVNGTLLSVRPWRSVVDSVFFRYASNPRMSCNELYHVIRQVRLVVERFRKKGSDSLSRIASRLVEFYSSLDFLSERVIHDQDPVLSDVLYYARVVPDDVGEKGMTDERVHGQLYRLFRMVYAFLEYRDLFNADYDMIMSALRQSQEFFRVRDYKALTDSLAFIEDSGEDLLDIYMLPSAHAFGNDRREVDSGIVDDPPNPKNSLLLDAARLAHVKIERSIKHREVNDLNIKFVNYGTI